MKKHRSMSYYARREKLRGMLTDSKSQRKRKRDTPQPANENRQLTAEDATRVDGGRAPTRAARDDQAEADIGTAGT
ncbi:MAG TPA: hypothetical protein VGN82_03475 [Bosea sp. (in: a-proteobacteria)]|jgi:hypothetical protein|uniref:hypothetical protein n=1 Tax=Bosea sp. (in: a-proteobacteria) TaxID=1871050 RepID=UPI002E15DE11|nr:hypothetical protein [Bosea sp. (in: a-proteobacteria)]